MLICLSLLPPPIVPVVCRHALSLIGADGEHASIYMHVQGNLGALLLSADRPAEAITEFEGALKLGQKLVQQLQQQIKQHMRKHKGKKEQQQQVCRAESVGGGQQAIGWSVLLPHVTDPLVLTYYHPNTFHRLQLLDVP